jgi:uncharacterized protein (DUF1015 family)
MTFTRRGARTWTGLCVVGGAAVVVALHNTRRFVDKGWLVRDAKPAFYVYRAEQGGVVMTGVMALSSVEQYKQGLIKRHEETVTVKLEDRIKVVKTQNANVGPVFLSYKEDPTLRARFDEYSKRKPSLVVDPAYDGAKHSLWRIDDPDECALIQAAFDKNVDALYICDGHHRAESAFRVGLQLKEEAKGEVAAEGSDS